MASRGEDGSTPPRKRARSRSPRPEDAHPILREARKFLERKAIPLGYPRLEKLDWNDVFSVMAHGVSYAEFPELEDTADESDDAGDAHDDTNKIHTCEAIDTNETEVSHNDRNRTEEDATEPHNKVLDDLALSDEDAKTHP